MGDEFAQFELIGGVIEDKMTVRNFLERLPVITLSKKHSAYLIFAMSALMWLTRGHHMASLAYLPDASWAIFFAVGFYFSSIGVVALFLAQAFLIDYLVVNQLGVGQSCFTLAYAFLLPAYLSMWFAGKWLAKRYALNFTAFKNFLFAAVVGVIICELISSGSYYVMNVPGQASLTEFAARMVRFLPFALEITLAYLVAGLVAHLVAIAIFQKTHLFQSRK